MILTSPRKCSRKKIARGVADVEALLSSVFILLKKEQVIGGHIENVLRLLDAAVKIASTERGVRTLPDSKGFGRRVATRIAFLDCRAAFLRQGEGKFVSCLRADERLGPIFTPDEGSSVEREPVQTSCCTARETVMGSIARWRFQAYRLLDRRPHGQGDGGRA